MVWCGTKYNIFGEKVSFHEREFLSRTLNSGLNFDMPLCADVGNSVRKALALCGTVGYLVCPENPGWNEVHRQMIGEVWWGEIIILDLGLKKDPFSNIGN